MKIAIKVLTEWDRENVIPFFEKHFPNCNKAWHSGLIEIGYTFWLRADNKLFMDYYGFETPSDYTILQGVPKDMELPKLPLEYTCSKCETKHNSVSELIHAENGIDYSYYCKKCYNLIESNGEYYGKSEPTKTREQELEECLSVFVKVYDESVNKEYPQETINALIPFLNQATKAKQLLNK